MRSLTLQDFSLELRLNIHIEETKNKYFMFLKYFEIFSVDLKIFKIFCADSKI